jgi:beta-galactosidase
VVVRTGRLTYVGSWGDDDLLDRVVAATAQRAALATTPMRKGVRIPDTATERFWFNYDPHQV